MTASLPTSHEPAARIDVRCSAEIPRSRPSEGRCQLLAGHDGPHAVLFVQDGTRLVRTWADADHPRDIDGALAGPMYPWMRGFPAPAWFEADASASRVR